MYGLSGVVYRVVTLYACDKWSDRPKWEKGSLEKWKIWEYSSNFLF